jgi:ribonuclease III
MPDLRHLQPAPGHHTFLTCRQALMRGAAGRGVQVNESGGLAGRSDGLLKALQMQISTDLLERALMHRSFAYENGGLPTNERLEFLGDSVLGLIVTDTLFRQYPDLPEGQLAKLRAAVVNMRALAGVARGLGLGSYVRLGKGEEGTGGRDKSSILADTLEAVIGAAYLDRGLPAADDLVHRLFDPVIARSARLGAGLDWKTSLQEQTAAEGLGVPEYSVEESGPDHQKSFRAYVRISNKIYGVGEGRSKKEAEQQAAEAAWNAINEGLADGTTSDGPALDGPALDGAVPEGAVSEGAVSEGAVSEGAVSEGAAPDGPASDGAAGDGNACESPAPDGPASGRAVSGDAQSDAEQV